MKKTSVKKMLTIPFALVLSATVAFGQENKTDSTAEEQEIVLTIDQAVDYALQNSRSIKSADIDLEMKKRAGANSWNCLLPSVSISETIARSASVTGVANASESLHWAEVRGLSADLTLTLGYIGQIKKAKLDYETGKLSYQQTLSETKVNVQKMFFGLLLKQEDLRLKKATLENSKQRFEQARINYRNGFVPELSMLQAQVTYENNKPVVANSERELKQDMDTFAFIIGMPVGTKFRIEGSIEPEYVEVDYDKLVSEYLQSSLDIQSMNKNIAAASIGITALNLQTFVPALMVSYAYQPTLVDWLDGDKGGFPDGGNWTDNGKVSFTLGWNITNMLPWSSSGQTRKDAQAGMKKLKIQKELLLENKKVNVKKAVDTLVAARDQIDSMSRSITLAQRSYDMTYKAYRSGTKELLDVRDAESQLNEAKLGLASQKFNYISALLDLEQTLNTKLLPENKPEETTK